MQHDAMDDAPASGVDVAEAAAAAAALFHAPSGDLAERFAAAAPSTVLPVPRLALSGGLPVRSTAGSWRASASAGTRAVPVRRARGRRRWRTVGMTVRVCVVGCGAIGSLYAAHLARLDDVEVWAVDPYAAPRRRASRTRGRPAGDRASSRVRPPTVHATTDPADVPPCDFGIVATKAEHTRAAVAARRTSSPTPRVASVQNGLGNEEVIAELVPRVIRGTILAGRRGHRRPASSATTPPATPGSGRSSRSPAPTARSQRCPAAHRGRA